MTKTTSGAEPLIVRLPFPGFYCSTLSDEVDRAEEAEVERLVERQAEDGVPPELQLERDDFAGALSAATDHHAVRLSVARGYVDAFNEVVRDRAGIDLRLRFESMTSPKFYNFETDRLFAHVPRGVVRKLYATSTADGHKHLAEVVREHFTDRSGFISYYSSDVAAWIAKPLMDWDHNELCALLEAALPAVRSDDVHDLLFADDAAGEWLAREVDQERFDERVDVVRAGKIAEQVEADPSYVPPPERCRLTLDMFGA